LGDLGAGGCGNTPQSHALLTMTALNRNQRFSLGFPMRAMRAAVSGLLVAPALSGSARLAALVPGKVAAPGQYRYLPDMSAESAVAGPDHG
jgi:hypothetical protein